MRAKGKLKILGKPQLVAPSQTIVTTLKLIANHLSHRMWSLILVALTYTR